jgi:hypothetical protein
MKAQRTLGLVLAFALLSGSIYTPIAQAALVGTDRAIETISQQHTAEEARDRLALLLERDEIAAQLKAFGVDPVHAQSRVDKLSDEEVMRLTGQLEQLPAGAGIVGAALLVFFVLLVTDLLGLTDVFPFVKK